MNANAPLWIRALAHLSVLTKLWNEKIIPNIIMIAVLIAGVTYLHDGVSFANSLAVVVAYSAAFMVNFFVQFARYRSLRPGLASDNATTLGQMTAALDREYHDMMKVSAPAQK